MSSNTVSIEKKTNLLLNAIYDNNAAVLRQLYSARADIAKVNIFGAAATADINQVKRFIQSATHCGGPRQAQAINYCANACFQQFDEGFIARQLQVGRMLLDAGADPNNQTKFDSKGNTTEFPLSALYGCCRKPGNPRFAELLLKFGAKTNDNESVYHASELEDVTVLNQLFQAGVVEQDREYCIARALDFDNPAALEVFLTNGASPNHLPWALFRNRSEACIDLLLQYGAKLDTPSIEEGLRLRIKGLYPVQIAQRNGQSRIVTTLLNAGASDTRTAVDMLIGLCVQGLEEEVHSLLMQHPNIKDRLTEQDRSFFPAIAREGNLKAIALLLSAGFDIEAKADDLETTALGYAACNGDTAMIQLLLKYSPDLRTVNKYGGNPLSAAIYCAQAFPKAGADYPETVRLLIEAGIEPLAQYLKFASEHELSEIAEQLISAGVML